MPELMDGRKEPSQFNLDTSYENVQHLKLRHLRQYLEHKIQRSTEASPKQVICFSRKRFAKVAQESLKILTKWIQDKFPETYFRVTLQSANQYT